MIKLNEKEKRLLRRALELVQGTHWVKGAYQKFMSKAHPKEEVSKFDPDGKECWCLVGILNHVTGNIPSSDIGSIGRIQRAIERDSTIVDARGGVRAISTRERLAAAVWAAIKAKNPHTQCNEIEEWNDRTRTTRADVVDVLERAIA